jgi:hypothetical protein
VSLTGTSNDRMVTVCQVCDGRLRAELLSPSRSAPADHKDVGLWRTASPRLETPHNSFVDESSVGQDTCLDERLKH